MKRLLWSPLTIVLGVIALGVAASSSVDKLYPPAEEDHFRPVACRICGDTLQYGYRGPLYGGYCPSCRSVIVNPPERYWPERSGQGVAD